ncbi:MAG TPA: hypothetical protein ENJ87_08870 [Gammaproteobacteria bacterium]|nr:hypothetical protein [Gammaproteobacteria bacterium]
MKLSIISSAILCTVAVTGLVSCGSSSNSSATSGNAVVGKITGFGSIIMNNGVEYDTSGLAACEVDDQSVSGVCEDSLSVGMHVTLRTDNNGAVTSFKYDDDLEGVSSNVTGTGGNYTFEVYGVTISTSSPDTQWDDFDTNPPTAAELAGVNVEISGEWQGDVLVASYVEKQSAGDTSVEVKGTVGAITGAGFQLTLKNKAGTTIPVDAGGLSQLPAEGAFVELKGTFDGTTFIATDFDAEDTDDFEDDSEAEITGTLLANADSSTGFSIGNTNVDISGAASCTGLEGTETEAKGRFDQATSVLVVEKCESEEDDLEARCQISKVTMSADLTKPKVGSVECSLGNSGGPLVFTFNDSPNLATFSDDTTANTANLSNFSEGDCAEIKFSSDGNGGYNAGLIKHEGNGGCNEVEIKGPVDVGGFNDGVDITVLGVTFTATNPATMYSPGNLNMSLAAGDKVKIIDTDANGSADEVEADE